MENNESSEARLVEDFRKIAADTEALLRSLEGAAGDVARKTDALVHENPWRAVTVAGAVGLIAGIILGRRR